MLKARVIGQVWATKKNPILHGQRLLLVTPDNQLVIVVWDTLGAKFGESVIVTFGSGARNAILPGQNKHLLVDAAISKILDTDRLTEKD